MSNSIRITRFLPRLLVALLVALLHAPAVGAQERPILVVVPDEFPAIDAKAIVLRERGRDVLLLPSDGATVDALAVSLDALRRAREQSPRPATGQMIPITGFAVTRDAPPEVHRRLSRLLDRLAAQPTTDIGDYGTGRWVRYVGG